MNVWIIDAVFFFCSFNLNVRVCVLQSFKSVAEKDEAFPESVKNLISTSYDPLYKFHQGFLKEVEQRLAQWSVSVCSHSENLVCSRHSLILINQDYILCFFTNDLRGNM